MRHTWLERGRCKPPISKERKTTTCDPIERPLRMQAHQGRKTPSRRFQVERCRSICESTEKSHARQSGKAASPEIEADHPAPAGGTRRFGAPRHALGIQAN